MRGGGELTEIPTRRRYYSLIISFIVLALLVSAGIFASLSAYGYDATYPNGIRERDAYIDNAYYFGNRNKGSTAVYGRVFSPVRASGYANGTYYTIYSPLNQMYYKGIPIYVVNCAFQDHVNFPLNISQRDLNNARLLPSVGHFPNAFVSLDHDGDMVPMPMRFPDFPYVHTPDFVNNPGQSDRVLDARNAAIGYLLSLESIWRLNPNAAKAAGVDMGTEPDEMAAIYKAAMYIAGGAIDTYAVKYMKNSNFAKRAERLADIALDFGYRGQFASITPYGVLKKDSDNPLKAHLTGVKLAGNYTNGMSYHKHGLKGEYRAKGFDIKITLTGGVFADTKSGTRIVKSSEQDQSFDIDTPMGEGKVFAKMEAKIPAEQIYYIDKGSSEQDVMFGVPKMVSYTTNDIDSTKQMDFDVKSTISKPNINGAISDDITVTSKGNWTKVHNTPVDVKANVRLYKGLPNRAKGSSIADAELLETKKITFSPLNGDNSITKKVDFDYKAVNGGVYFVIVNIDKNEQSNPVLFKDSITTPSYEPTETTLVPMRLSIDTKANTREVKPGTPISDTANVNVLNGEWIKNTSLNVAFDLYYMPIGSNIKQSNTVPDNAEKVFSDTKTINSAGQVTSSQYTPNKPGYYTWVARIDKNDPQNSNLIEETVTHDFAMANETVSVPQIQTDITSDGNTLYPNAPKDDDSLIPLADKITFKGLTPNVEREYFAELRNTDTCKPVLDENGNPITVKGKFTPKASDGTFDVIFNVKASLIKGKPLSAFETVILDGIPTATHHDCGDRRQQMFIPEIKTTATNKDGDSKNISTIEKTVTHKDNVQYKAVHIGQPLTIVGYPVYTDTGMPVLKDGKKIVVSKTFTPTSRNGQIELVFEIPTQLVKGQRTVYFETMIYKGRTIAEHQNKDDENQTVYNPSISSKARIVETNNQYFNPNENATIRDTISVKAVRIGSNLQYIAKAINKADNRQLATATYNFTANKNNVDIDVDMKLPSNTITDGNDIVLTGVLTENNKVLDKHEDLNNPLQTIHAPNIKTTATDKADGDKYLITDSDEKATIVDKVEYTNLIVGKKHVISGYLLKENGSPLLINGEKIFSRKEFVPNTPSGSVELEYTYPAKLTEGKKVIVAETVYYERKPIKVHADINDIEQTIYTPKVTTKLMNTIGDSKHVLDNNDNSILVDILNIEGLKPTDEINIDSKIIAQQLGSFTNINRQIENPVFITNKAYNELAQMRDKKPMPNATKPKIEKIRLPKLEELEKQTSITADSQGRATVYATYEIKGSDYKGMKLIGVATASIKNNKIAQHYDLNNEDQTVRVPLVKTRLLNVEGKKTLTTGINTLVEQVSYCGLIPNQNYEAKTKLIVDGKETNITSSTMFTPKQQCANINVVFSNVDLTKYNNKNVVAFTEIVNANTKLVVGKHADLNSKEQTVKISIPSIPPLVETGINKSLIIITIIMASLGGMLLVYANSSKSRRKPKHE